MKIAIAMDSFKGSLTTEEAAACVEAGLKSAIECECVKIPLADGGAGTARVIASALGASQVSVTVKNPFWETINAHYGISGECAIIEMAEASGLNLIEKSRRNVLKSTSYGTGELILDALRRGCKKITLALGGSATNDGGAGIAAALGVRFYDENGNEFLPLGESLGKIERIELSGLSALLKSAQITAACDVTNTLCGEFGASRVFAPQKGASAKEVEILETNMCRYAFKIHEYTSINISRLSGGGAAGGAAAGICAFLGAKIERGFDVTASAVKLREKLADADVVITGEGRTDFQSAFGKLPFCVAKLSKELNKRCVIISGAVKGDVSKLYESGAWAIFSASDESMSTNEAMQNARRLLSAAAAKAAVSLRLK